MKPNQRLKRERELRGWSQARVAEAIGTTTLTVGRWERGEAMPYPSFREKLCVLFGKDVEALGLLTAAQQEDVPAHTVPALPMRDPAIPCLPLRNARLIGREDLLLSLKKRLCEEARPTMAALHGLPGVGKTSLALHLASDSVVQACFPDGILWVGLGPTPDSIELLSRWGTLLGISLAAGGTHHTSEAWARAIHTAIGVRQMLLIIDDAWTIEDALALQVGGPQCASLVTTRYPHLAVQLSANGAIAIPELTEHDGVTLLAGYVSAFVTQTPETALALVRSVGALPLALALIGKYLQVQSQSGQPRRLLAAVEHLRDTQARLQLSEAHALVDRHPSMLSGTSISLQSMITVSYHLLNAQAQAALLALSVFPAKPQSFSEEAALEVCQAPVEILDGLSDVGLLESHGPGRYMLHQTIADYARMTLTDTAASSRLVTYYVRFIEEHATDPELLAQEINPILVAFEEAYQLNQHAALVRGVCAFVDFLYRRGLYAVTIKHLKRAHEAAKMLNDTDREIQTLRFLGEIERAWGNLTQAEALLHEGLALARVVGRDEQISDLLRNLGLVEDNRGNYTVAEGYFLEGLELASQFAQHEQMCHLLTGIGIVSNKLRRTTAAEASFQKALGLARHLGNYERCGALLLNLGWLASEQGNYDQAEAYYQECLSLAQHYGYDQLQGGLLVNLGALLISRGRYDQSRAYLQNALVCVRRVGNHLWVDQALLALGELAVLENQTKQAEAYLLEGLEIARRLEHREIIGGLLTMLGEMEGRRGNDEQAARYLQEAMSLVRNLGWIFLVCLTLSSWGDLHLRCHQIDEALDNFQEIGRLALQSHRELQALAAYGQARVAYARQNVRAAREHGETSLALFTAIGHRRTTEVQNWLAQV
ncbi:MAG: tetratricopeptide repeat protein [Ktedonobacteraceae bacterium]